MHDKDLALAWERWCCGEILSVIADDFNTECSRLHQELQDYLTRKTAEQCVELSLIIAVAAA